MLSAVGPNGEQTQECDLRMLNASFAHVEFARSTIVALMLPCMTASMLRGPTCGMRLRSCVRSKRVNTWQHFEIQIELGCLSDKCCLGQSCQQLSERLCKKTEALSGAVGHLVALMLSASAHAQLNLQHVITFALNSILLFNFAVQSRNHCCTSPSISWPVVRTPSLVE